MISSLHLPGKKDQTLLELSLPQITVQLTMLLLPMKLLPLQPLQALVLHKTLNAPFRYPLQLIREHQLSVLLLLSTQLSNFNGLNGKTVF